MRLRLIPMILALFAAESLLALDLPSSKLLKPTDMLLAQTDEEQPGFTEIISDDSGAKTRKNPWRAFGMSLLLPGGGQYYVGAETRTKLFVVVEVGLWSAFAAFRHQGNWREDDFRLLAMAKAGANLDGKDERFFDVLGFYDSREEYNKLGGVYNRNREYYPDNSFYFWKWDSEESRLKYRDLKNDSRSFFRKADFTLGLIAANHLLAAIDAYFAARRHNRGIESGFSSIDMQFSADGGFLVTVEARF